METFGVARESSFQCSFLFTRSEHANGIVRTTAIQRVERVRTSGERISITLRVVLITTFGRSTYSSSSQRRLHKSRSKADQIKRTNERTKREVERNCKFERNSGFRATPWQRYVIRMAVNRARSFSEILTSGYVVIV